MNDAEAKKRHTTHIFGQAPLTPVARSPHRRHTSRHTNANAGAHTRPQHTPRAHAYTRARGRAVGYSARVTTAQRPPRSALLLAAAQPEDEMDGALLPNVIIANRLAIIELLAAKDEPLLLGRDALLVLRKRKRGDAGSARGRGGEGVRGEG